MKKVGFGVFFQCLRWLVRFTKAAVFLGLVGVVATLMLWWSRGCYTEELARFTAVAGFDFEVSMTDCWHNPQTGVFVSRPGHPARTLLLQYESPKVPSIKSIDGHTVRIELRGVDSIQCRRREWQGLSVEYDIEGQQRLEDRPEC